MILGIVGHEAAKFTPDNELIARHKIQELFYTNAASYVVSGGCHLGGIDIWAVEEAQKINLPFKEYIPLIHTWNHADGGYKQRNIAIAEAADKVISIVVRELPTGYTGMRFPMCYHYKTDSHVKSGGCWTARYAGKLGKPFEIVEI